jgi:hypothetical protein
VQPIQPEQNQLRSISGTNGQTWPIVVLSLSASMLVGGIFLVLFALFRTLRGGDSATGGYDEYYSGTGKRTSILAPMLIFGLIATAIGATGMAVSVSVGGL